jgi:hypothetical protein
MDDWRLSPFDARFQERAIPHSEHPKMWKVPVKIQIVDTVNLLVNDIEVRVMVVARSATDAANWVREHLKYIPNTHIVAWGPKGGEVHRHIGPESAIGAMILDHVDKGKAWDNLEVPPPEVVEARLDIWGEWT